MNKNKFFMKKYFPPLHQPIDIINLNMKNTKK